MRANGPRKRDGEGSTPLQRVLASIVLIHLLGGMSLLVSLCVEFPASRGADHADWRFLARSSAHVVIFASVFALIVLSGVVTALRLMWTPSSRKTLGCVVGLSVVCGLAFALADLTADNMLLLEFSRSGQAEHHRYQEVRDRLEKHAVRPIEPSASGIPQAVSPPVREAPSSASAPTEPSAPSDSVSRASPHSRVAATDRASLAPIFARTSVTDRGSLSTSRWFYGLALTYTGALVALLFLLLMVLCGTPTAQRSPSAFWCLLVSTLFCLLWFQFRIHFNRQVKSALFGDASIQQVPGLPAGIGLSELAGIVLLVLLFLVSSWRFSGEMSGARKLTTRVLGLLPAGLVGAAASSGTWATTSIALLLEPSQTLWIWMIVSFLIAVGIPLLFEPPGVYIPKPAPAPPGRAPQP